MIRVEIIDEATTEVPKRNPLPQKSTFGLNTFINS